MRARLVNLWRREPGERVEATLLALVHGRADGLDVVPGDVLRGWLPAARVGELQALGSVDVIRCGD